MSRRGGKLLTDQLAVHGTELAFCVPGESYLELLDGLYESPIRLITCRHEAGAANVAEAYGKLTGRPGICMVTRGPGATQASVGVHTAFQDSTPLILLVGQVASSQEEREAFQEIDYRRMFGPLAKWVAQIDSVDRIPELVARAYTVACAGRPGPVVLALPEDMLAQESDAPDAPPFRVVQPSPAAADIESLRTLLAGAERPFAILGGAGWTPQASEDIQVLPRGERRCPRARRSGGRTRSTTTRRRTSATSASESTRRSRRASAMPTSCSSSARGSAR